MSTSKKCRAQGGPENCTNPNCPEKHDGFKRLLDDFNQHLDRQVPFAGTDDGLRSTNRQPEFKTQEPSAFTYGFNTDADYTPEPVATEWLDARAAAMANSMVMPITSLFNPTSADATVTGAETKDDISEDDGYDWQARSGNPVDYPEKFGMESFADVSLPAADYSFYYAAVLKNSEGFWLTTDSGCSCPTPWENHTANDLTGPLTADQVAEELQSLHDSCDSYDKSEYTVRSVREAVVKLRGAKFMAENPDVHPSLVEEMFKLD